MNINHAHATFGRTSYAISTNIIKRMNKLRTYLVGSLLLTSLSANAADIDVHDAYVNAPPPISKVAAGYLVLQNNTGEVRVLKSFSSPAAGKVELHKTSDDNGQMRMRKMESLQLAPHGSVELSPGGMHLMFMKLKKSFTPGDSVPVSLHFANGEIVNIEAKVKDMRRRSESHGHMGHDNHHDQGKHHHNH